MRFRTIRPELRFRQVRKRGLSEIDDCENHLPFTIPEKQLGSPGG